MTKILIPSETSSGERRVSATPEAVKKLKSLGCDVYIESSAGKLSGFSDLSYEESGGTIISNFVNLFFFLHTKYKLKIVKSLGFLLKIYFLFFKK